ncbi:MAG: vWA domain-containing protein [Verrucomicrobiota bacterium]
MKPVPRFHPKEAAISMVEVLLAVAAIAIIAAIAIPSYSIVVSGTSASKLETDVVKINSAIKIYRASGGSLEGITNPQAALDKLKTVRNGDKSEEYAGLRGSMIDKRLAVRPQTPEQVSSDQLRAHWDSANQRFQLSTSGAGIHDFYLDSELAAVDFGSEDRKESAIAYNTGDGWIWNHGDANPLNGPTPTEVPLTPGSSSSSSGSGSGSGSGASGTSGTGGGYGTGNDPPAELQPPIFTPAGGQFPYSAFDLQVTITNPNPPEDSWIMVSVNGSPFTTYSGSVTVSPNSYVSAYVDGNPSFWNRSSTVIESYAAGADELLAPEIELSATTFDQNTETIEVTLLNPNVSGSSQLFYTVKAPSESFPDVELYTMYSGPITLAADSFPEGFDIQAYAKSLDTTRWTDSPFANAATTADFFDVPITEERILFVVDASGSMNNEFLETGYSRYETVKQHLVETIGNLPSNVNFGVAMFDGGVHWKSGNGELLPATSSNKETTIHAVQVLNNGRGTNYDAGLSIPTQYSPLPDQVIFLSDGRPNHQTSWYNDLDTLVSLGIKVDTVGLELDGWAASNLQRIAEETGGSFTTIE